MTNIPPFTVDDFEGFKVVRDDLFDGGTKRRAFERMIDSIEEEELVYACDYYGHAAYAIALTAMGANKKVKLFYLSPKKETEIFKKTTSLSNVNYEIVEGASTQVEVAKTAEKYAKENNARFLTIGLDFPEFIEVLTGVVKEVGIQAPEIWCMGGSGALARSLKKAYPDIPVKVVSIGTLNGFFEGTDTVYDAPEKLGEEAEVKPPYPSAPHYDAKVWRFIKEHAQPRAFVWNVAP